MLTFGRYTDSYKKKEKLDAWTNAEKLFGEKNYFESYKNFFEYIRDDSIQNVTYEMNDSSIKFELLQGSKIIKGTVDNNRITAEARLASYDKLSVALMRRLLEMNYTLYYSKFAFNDNNIVIKFSTSVVDGPPRKIYYALKELAIRADRQDDLLLDDFSTLKSLDKSIVEITPEGKELKYKYFIKWINENVTKVSTLNESQMTGGISYLLLHALYKIDYLITPQGSLMNEIEKMSNKYFANDNKTLEEKNRELKESLIKLGETEKDKVFEDLYVVRSTFGVVNPALHQSISDAIDSNIKNVKWYAEHSYVEIAEKIFEYIAGHCFFSFGMPVPTRELLDMIIQVMNEDYYKDSGRLVTYYDKDQTKLNEELIRTRIDEIINNWKDDYPELKVNQDDLKFDSRLSFMKSLMLAIQNLDYTNI